MLIGVPTELTEDENRVAATPSGVSAFVAHGHSTLVQAGAGSGSHIADESYRKAGASISSSAEEIWQRADIILKVKEPLEAEYPLLRAEQVIFTYLHLAASKRLAKALLAARVTAIAYETVQLEDGTLPLLVPMSEVAGRLAIQAGARCLEMKEGGKGILLPGVSGVRRGKVTVLGAGVAGFNACVAAVGLGAEVTVLDVNPLRLSYVRDVVQGHVTTLMSNRANVETAVAEADLVVGAVLIPGGKTPKLISRALLATMEKGSAFVDVSIDQGGCAETSRPTTHNRPRYTEEGVVHYAVANMPGAVPQTSTYALTNATLSYALSIADLGWEMAAAADRALARGVVCVNGRMTCEAAAQALGLDYVPLAF